MKRSERDLVLLLIGLGCVIAALLGIVGLLMGA